MLRQGISAQTVKLSTYLKSWICHLWFNHLDTLLNQLWDSQSEAHNNIYLVGWDGAVKRISICKVLKTTLGTW